MRSLTLRPTLVDLLHQLALGPTSKVDNLVEFVEVGVKTDGARDEPVAELG